MKIAIEGPDSLLNTDLEGIIDTWSELKNSVLAELSDIVFLSQLQHLFQFFSFFFFLFLSFLGWGGGGGVFYGREQCS